MQSLMRGPSPNHSDDRNSENAKTTLPIGERKTADFFTKQSPNSDYSKIHENSNPIGHNAFAFWTLVSIIFVLTVGNLILTMTIIGVLRLGKGMEFLELVPEADTVEFFGVTDLDRVYKKDGLLEGFADVPMTITGDNANAQISLVKGNGHIHNKMLMSKNGTVFSAINLFELKNPESTETIFSTHKPHFNMPGSVDNLLVKTMSTSRITAPIYENLNLNNTRGKLLFRGSEGVTMQAKEIILSVDQNLHFKTHNGSIVIAGNGGVYLDVRNIPIVGEHGIKIENKQYKICVCMPQGRLFRVAVAPTSHIVKGVCSHYNVKYDPCV